MDALLLYMSKYLCLIHLKRGLLQAANRGCMNVAGFQHLELFLMKIASEHHGTMEAPKDVGNMA
jgi:hypothetical protein